MGKRGVLTIGANGIMAPNVSVTVSIRPCHLTKCSQFVAPRFSLVFSEPGVVFCFLN